MLAIVLKENNKDSYKLTYEEPVLIDKVVNAEDKGSSKNRNELLKISTADYVIFSDDDQCFDADTYKTISSYLSKKEYNAFVFNIDISNKERKYDDDNIKNDRLCKKKDVLGSGVWRFVFKKSALSNLWFDEKIGPGTKYLCGEDTVFIAQFLKQNKKKVLLTTKNIGVLNQTESSWFDKLHSDEYIYAQGYTQKIIYPVLYPIYCVRSLLVFHMLTLKNLRKVFKGYKIIKNS